MTYPLPNFRFSVSLDSVDPYVPAGAPTAPAVLMVGSFSDVTGLSGELEVISHPEGGQNDFVHQLPVRHSWGRLTLKRGVVRESSLWQWFDQGLSGSPGARRDGAIWLQTPEGVPVVAWEFRAGLAARWTGPDLSAREGAIAIESLEIVHEGLRRRDVGVG